MAKYLLTSEAFVKNVSSISDNLAGKFLQPSIREAQDIKLKGIIGENLLDKLEALGKAGTLNADGNEAYLALVEQCQYFLAYSAIVEVCLKVSYKVGNFGVVKSNDENLQVATQDEIAKMQYYYQAKADSACIDLQHYVLENKASYPELKESTCNKIKANLYRAATCGIFLGGRRGYGRTYCNKKR